MDCQCSHEGTTTVPTPGVCTIGCAGCKFDQDIRCTSADGKCVFTGSVTRTACENQPDKTWPVNLTMRCGDADRVMNYTCDDAGECIGYKVTFSCSVEVEEPNLKTAPPPS